MESLERYIESSYESTAIFWSYFILFIHVTRNKDNMVQEDSKPLVNGEVEIISNPSGVQDNMEEEAVILQNTDCSSSGKSSFLKLEDSDAPRGQSNVLWALFFFNFVQQIFPFNSWI